MAVLEIRVVEDKVLRTKARPVKKIGPAVRKLLDDMAETMYHARGVGLAANQVGVLKRLIVVDPGEGPLYKLVNPEIVREEGPEEIGQEGCLSIPGKVGDVPRARRIRVHAWRETGQELWLDAEGYLARIIQHEVDHLNGILFTDRAVRVMDAQADEGAAAEPQPAENLAGQAGL